MTSVFGPLAPPVSAAPPLATPSISDPGIPPGDPGALQGAARSFTGMAGALDAEGQRIASTASALGLSWLGFAEAAFLGAAGKAIGDCRLAAGACHDASSALTTYATELQNAQDVARRAQAAAAAIRQASASLQSAYDQAVGNANAQAAAGKPVDGSALASLRSQAGQLQFDAGAVAAQAEAAQQQAQAAAAKAAGAFQSVAGRVGGLQSTGAASGMPGMHLPGDGKFWLKVGLGIIAPGGVLPAALAGAGGYRLLQNGRYVIVTGRRFAGPGLLNWYTRSGRSLAGTRYLADNPQVLRFLRPSAAVRSGLADIFDVTSPGFLRNIPKGGGAAAGLLTFGGDIYDFGLGSHRNQGLLSTDFAATTTVDGGLLAGSTAASAGVSALATAAIGGEAGSVVPGLGTAIGFGVGFGIGIFLQTSPGKAVRNTMIAGTKHAMDFAVQHPAEALAAVPVFQPIAPLALAVEHRHEIESAAVSGWHATEGVASGAWNATGGVRHAVGDFFGGL